MTGKGKATAPIRAAKKANLAPNLENNRSNQAVIVDYKALGCKYAGDEPNSKKFIHYSLEWLLIEQFDEIYICCLPDNATELRELVDVFMRTENVSPSMIIQVHSSEGNKSTGDCLRDLDAKGLIKNDFVIMDVGCCGNLPLAELLESHKKLKKTDKNAILTSIVRNVFTKNPAEVGEFPTYITDPKSGLLLHYKAGRVSENEEGRDLASKPLKSSIDVPSEIFLDRESVKVHTNLCSTNLSIYSSNVPALFAELFDCHSEPGLIQAVFDNQEVLGGTVYIHVVDDLFSQRMADFGFAINQKWEKFDTNLIYKRNDRYQVLRQLVNESLIDCTRLNSQRYLGELEEDENESELESDSDSDEPVMDDEEAFLIEVLDSLVRGYEEAIVNENLVLEVNSSKHAYNVSIEDVYSTIAKALILLPDKLSTDQPKSVQEYWSVISTSMKKFRKLLLNYIKSDDSRNILLTTMEEMYTSGQCKFLTDIVLVKTLELLYDIDVLDEDSILRWFRDYDKVDKSQKELRSKPSLGQLIEFLEDDSETDEE